MDTRLSLYFCLFLASGAGIWIVREAMASAVDERLPENEKIRRTTWNRTGFESGEMSRMWQAHRQFFPASRLRFWYAALWVFTILWMFFGLGILQGLSSWRK
jgi:hypothetical protein